MKTTPLDPPYQGGRRTLRGKAAALSLYQTHVIKNLTRIAFLFIMVHIETKIALQTRQEEP